MKKTFFSKLMLGALAVATGFAFTACSSDDTPVSPADEELSELQSRIYNEDSSTTVFMPTDNGDYFYVHCPSEEMAIKHIEYYTNTSGLSSTSATYNWKGDNGYFKVTSGNDEGLFFEVLFSLKGKAPFTVAFIYPGYEDSDNLVVSRPSDDSPGNPVWRCRQCLHIATGEYGNQSSWNRIEPNLPCPVCGADDWHLEWMFY